jgi:hypothetical protein
MGKYTFGPEIQGVVRIFILFLLANGRETWKCLHSEYANGSQHAEHLAQEWAQRNASMIDVTKLRVEFRPYTENIEISVRPTKAAVGVKVVA